MLDTHHVIICSNTMQRTMQSIVWFVQMSSVPVRFHNVAKQGKKAGSLTNKKHNLYTLSEQTLLGWNGWFSGGHWQIRQIKESCIEFQIIQTSWQRKTWCFITFFFFLLKVSVGIRDRVLVWESSSFIVTGGVIHQPSWAFPHCFPKTGNHNI